jgi:hypothetical protein
MQRRNFLKSLAGAAFLVGQDAQAQIKNAIKESAYLSMNVVPVIGIAYVEKNLGDLVTLPLGQNVCVPSNEFQSDLRQCGQWSGPVSHPPWSEQTWETLMEKALILFILAESFHPSIQLVLQQAKRFDVTAVVATHAPEIYPADIFPLLHVADGLDLTDAVRAIVGGATNSCMITMDLADIRMCIHQSRRSVQRIGVASSANQLPFAAQQALDRISISGADLARANSVLVWIRAGDELLVEDYRWAMMVVDGQVSADCLVNVAVENGSPAGGEASFIVTASWA